MTTDATAEVFDVTFGRPRIAPGPDTRFRLLGKARELTMDTTLEIAGWTSDHKLNERELEAALRRLAPGRNPRALVLRAWAEAVRQVAEDWERQADAIDGRPAARPGPTSAPA
jgi:hypothetical protein